MGELAIQRAPIAEATRCAALDALFRADPGMTSAIVGDADRAWLINRTSFHQALTGPRGYGWALYHRRPVEALPELQRSPIVLDAEDRAYVAALTVLAAEIATTDDVLVRWRDGDVGTLGVSMLLAALAEHHRQLAEAVSGSERRFRTLVEHSSDAIVLLDPDWSVTYAGPTGLAAVGRDPVRGGGVDLLEVIHPGDVARARVMLGRVLAEPGEALSAELRMLVADGDYRTFEVVARNMLSDPAVEGIVINYRDVTHQRELEDQLRHQALHDPLTQLPNRTLLLERITTALQRLRRSGRSTCLIYVDLDRFKSVNDTFGHSSGDRLLGEVAKALRTSIRPEDTLARLGGDEFAVLIDELDDATDAALAARRLHAALLSPLAAGEHDVQVEVSVGIAVADDPDVKAEELLRRADMAMYAAKAQGKNTTVSWSALLQTALFEDGDLCADLPGALDRGELFVVYQPIVDMSAGRACGVEALIRWRHPELGLIEPDRFIPLAERTSQITRIGRWVLETACAQVAAWRSEGTALRLSVNLSGVQLSNAGLPADVARILSVTGLPAEALELELTETALISSLENARHALDDLKALGVRVAIDDFGTGYSSLSYLRELPVDTLKIDKSFVEKLGRSDEDTEIVGGVIRLAHSIGLTVTAEGIEHIDQETVLRNMGCDAAQGYLYARPADASEPPHLFPEKHRESAQRRFPSRDPRPATAPLARNEA